MKKILIFLVALFLIFGCVQPSTPDKTKTKSGGEGAKDSGTIDGGTGEGGEKQEAPKEEETPEDLTKELTDLTDDLGDLGQGLS